MDMDDCEVLLTDAPSSPVQNLVLEEPPVVQVTNQGPPLTAVMAVGGGAIAGSVMEPGDADPTSADEGLSGPKWRIPSEGCHHPEVQTSAPSSPEPEIEDYTSRGFYMSLNQEQRHEVMDYYRVRIEYYQLKSLQLRRQLMVRVHQDQRQEEALLLATRKGRGEFHAPPLVIIPGGKENCPPHPTLVDQRVSDLRIAPLEGEAIAGPSTPRNGEVSHEGHVPTGNSERWEEYICQQAAEGNRYAIEIIQARNPAFTNGDGARSRIERSTAELSPAPLCSKLGMNGSIIRSPTDLVDPVATATRPREPNLSPEILGTSTSSPTDRNFLRARRGGPSRCPKGTLTDRQLGRSGVTSEGTCPDTSPCPDGTEEMSPPSEGKE